MSETAICSFVLRFVQPDGATTPPSEWHGWVRHVQSNTELRFNELETALDFINQQREKTFQPAANATGEEPTSQ